MGTLNVKVLGTGGAVNDGLPYISMLINDHFLLEAPPDVMLSLQTQNVDYEKIDQLYISHLHGDHTFGLPFLLLNKWLNNLTGKSSSPLTIYGPVGIKQHTLDLMKSAFSAENPSLAWTNEQLDFVTMDSDFEMKMDGLDLNCFEVSHITNTYGLKLKANAETIFAFTSDTRWCPAVEELLAEKPKVVMIDVNGGSGNMHITLDTVIDKGMPLVGPETLFYGIHLSTEFTSDRANLRCAKVGEVISIQY